jgi:hypothetical protein
MAGGRSNIFKWTLAAVAREADRQQEFGEASDAIDDEWVST